MCGGRGGGGAQYGRDGWGGGVGVGGGVRRRQSGSKAA